MKLTFLQNSILRRSDYSSLQKELAKRRREQLIRFVTESHHGYLAGWVHKEICTKLEKFSRDTTAGLSPRLMIFMPPRHGKSMIASERFPIWHLGHNPEHSILLTSYGQKLSDRFSKRARDIAQSEFFKETFPDFALDPNKQSVHEWQTSKGGSYSAVGIGGSATGKGADILIIDDPVKNAMEAKSKTKQENDWEWYRTTAHTRLFPGRGILVIQTRWNEGDLAGRLIDAMKEDGDQWDIICYPALAEHDEEHRKKDNALHKERYDNIKLHRIRKIIGMDAWNSLYQQRPTAEEGNMFKKEWFKTFKIAPSRFERKVISWDLSFKDGETNDFIAGGLWGKLGADYYFLDLVHKKADFIETKKEVEDFSSRHPSVMPILIEDKANGPAVISSLENVISGIVAVNPQGSKEARALVITPIAEAGNIHLPEDAPWLDKFKAELFAFPKGKHDDMVDQMTQAISHLMDEGKMAVFKKIDSVFGSPEAYDESSSWICEHNFGRSAFIGVRCDVMDCVFYAFNELKVNIGYMHSRSRDPNEILRSLKSFASGVGKSCQPVVSIDSSGLGETISRLASFDTSMDWRLEPFKSSVQSIDEMVANMTDAIDDMSVSLRPWLMLFDQMSWFRAKQTDKGNICYSAPDGLSSNAVTAMLVAYGSVLKNDTEAVAAIVNDFDRIGSRLYYGTGEIDDID
jgi:predicted phage terminase large subunit-like protein